MCVYSLYCILYIVLYKKHCIVYNVYCTVCIVHCTLYSVHCTMSLVTATFYAITPTFIYFYSTLTYIHSYVIHSLPPSDHCNLIGLHILHGEVEPYSKTGIASVRPYEQIILDVRYIIHSAEIS